MFFAVVAACTPSAPASTVPAPAPTAKPVVTTLRVGTTGAYPPLSIGPVGSPHGLAPKLAQTFTMNTKRDITFVPFTWPSLGSDLMAGKFEMAADGITVRPDRSITGRFTVPFARGGAVLIVRAKNAGAKVATLDRPDFRIVVNKGGHLEHVAHDLFKSAHIEALDVNAEVGATLARGEADGAMTNTFEAQEWLPAVKDGAVVGPLTNDVTAFWLRADQAELETELDDFLMDREETGGLAADRREWLKGGAGPKAGSPVSALFAATAERLALMPYVAAAKAQTKQAVEDPAQEKRVLATSADAVAKAAAEKHLPVPNKDVVDLFFRTQIEAAKEVQAHAKLPSDKSYSLDSDLRPAIARISARMARILVRVRHASTGEVSAEARQSLESFGLSENLVDRFIYAVAAMATAD